MKTYKIIMYSMGGTEETMYSGLPEEEAIRICEDYGWQVSPDGGYVWDLDIEEDDD